MAIAEGNVHVCAHVLIEEGVKDSTRTEKGEFKS